MIPRDFITEWRRYAPWLQSYQVEHDLVISRSLVAIFSNPLLATNLAFRGGTALFKLHLPPVRYSEDIDLVQVKAGPIGSVLDVLRSELDPWLGEPKRSRGEGRVTLVYRFASEEELPLRLKVEINSREHFALNGYVSQPFSVESRWFSGRAEVLTYTLEELLATKLRALYQRKKGRDLFDLWYALSQAQHFLDDKQVLACFLGYMERGGHQVSRAQFERNLLTKVHDQNFARDIEPLLTSDGEWQIESAIDVVMNRLLSLLPGDPWQGQ